MTWDLPWVASGSAEIPLDVARAFTYAATDGVSGIIGQPFSNVLKINQTGSPSGSVMTLSGAFVAVSKFAGAVNESYVGRNDATITTSVPATTASSRSDLVYAHITDPSQAGQPALASIVETRVITNVASNTVSLNTVSGYENQTGLALARIDRPSGTSTVTTAQIVDLRLSALPSIVGDLKSFAGASVNIPQNWGLCNGAAVSRATYPELFAMIGTTYGVGNGTTTFNLPNFNGRSPIGVGAADSGSVGNSYILGHKFGHEALQAHRHGTNGMVVPTSGSGTVPATVQSGADVGFHYFAAGFEPLAGTGTGGNVHPVLGVNFLIRMQ